MSTNKAAQNLDAILDKRHITYVQFAGMLKSQGHHITPKQLVRAIGANHDPRMTRKHVTPDMIRASAQALDVSTEQITG